MRRQPHNCKKEIECSHLEPWLGNPSVVPVQLDAEDQIGCRFFHRQESRRTPDLDRSAPVWAPIWSGQMEWNEDQQYLNETTGFNNQNPQFDYVHINVQLFMDENNSGNIRIDVPTSSILHAAIFVAK
jgi:hypothetical protein